MNKLTAKEYQLLIAEALVNSYGSTLVEDETDLNMAVSVVKVISQYLDFRQDKSCSQYKFKKKRQLFLEKLIGIEARELMIYQKPQRGITFSSLHKE